MAIELVYETHSITTDNEAGIATGWLPGTLSAAGRVSAEQVGDRRRSDRIGTVFVSDLRRAIETAEVAFEGARIPIVLDPRLRECNYGRLNGMPRTQLDADRNRHLDEPWPGGESYREVVRRTAAFLEALAGGQDGARVLVIAHSANHWAIEHLLLGKDLGGLVDGGMTWQPGWEYVLPAGWQRPAETRAVRDRQRGTGLTEDAVDDGYGA